MDEHQIMYVCAVVAVTLSAHSQPSQDSPRRPTSKPQDPILRAVLYSKILVVCNLLLPSRREPNEWMGVYTFMLRGRGGLGRTHTLANFHIYSSYLVSIHSWCVGHSVD